MRSADAKRSERGALIQKRVGARSAEAKKVGARSGGKSWSADRRCQKGSECGVAMSNRVGSRSDFYPRTGPVKEIHYNGFKVLSYELHYLVQVFIFRTASLRWIQFVLRCSAIIFSYHITLTSPCVVRHSPHSRHLSV